MRVIATGRLKQHSYQTQDGSQRTVIDATCIDEMSPSLRYATAQVTRVQSGRGYSGGSVWGPAKPANGQGWQNTPGPEPPACRKTTRGLSRHPPLQCHVRRFQRFFIDSQTPNSKEIQCHERKRPMACRMP